MSHDNTTIISWNLNGIRAAVRNGLFDVIHAHPADIWCFQEVRADVEHLRDILPINGFAYAHSTHAEKKGYSGVMTISKIKPESVREGIGVKEFDSEGRVLTLEFADYFLVNTYFPNTQHELARLDYKLAFDKAITSFIKKLEEKKPVIITGDFNVAHQEIDLKNPKENERNAGFTIEERTAFTELLNEGYIDTFRDRHPETVRYSWWSYRFRARERDIGWRIDYFLASHRLASKIKHTDILTEVMGSDHCPVTLTIDI